MPPGSRPASGRPAASVEALLSRRDASRKFGELIPWAEGWMRESVCAQTDPELWYPETGQSLRSAKRICRTCPVRDECLAYALKHDERFGVWGGLSERERRALKRRPLLLDK